MNLEFRVELLATFKALKLVIDKNDNTLLRNCILSALNGKILHSSLQILHVLVVNDCIDEAKALIDTVLTELEAMPSIENCK
ncbi:MAG: hypothetical protein FWC78_01290 [Defluviitaleaceae bacterium]|nr:hypothetical protein [Defluviitaleaceae bacterium]